MVDKGSSVESKVSQPGLAFNIFTKQKTHTHSRQAHYPSRTHCSSKHLFCTIIAISPTVGRFCASVVMIWDHCLPAGTYASFVHFSEPQPGCFCRWAWISTLIVDLSEMKYIEIWSVHCGWEVVGWLLKILISLTSALMEMASRVFIV